eukprot:3211370-Rhodomonas_salina.1
MMIMIAASSSSDMASPVTPGGPFPGRIQGTGSRIISESPATPSRPSSQSHVLESFGPGFRVESESDHPAAESLARAWQAQACRVAAASTGTSCTRGSLAVWCQCGRTRNHDGLPVLHHGLLTQQGPGSWRSGVLL